MSSSRIILNIYSHGGASSIVMWPGVSSQVEDDLGLYELPVEGHGDGAADADHCAGKTVFIY